MKFNSGIERPSIHPCIHLFNKWVPAMCQGLCLPLGMSPGIAHRPYPWAVSLVAEAQFWFYGVDIICSILEFRKEAFVSNECVHNRRHFLAPLDAGNGLRDRVRQWEMWSVNQRYNDGIVSNPQVLFCGWAKVVKEVGGGMDPTDSQHFHPRFQSVGQGCDPGITF